MISVPLLLMIFVLLMMPRTPVDPNTLGSDPFDLSSTHLIRTEFKRYAVIFDAGSSGSRVHVYCFGKNLELLPMGDKIELFQQTKPGLSHYASNPKEGADSLESLLDEAINAVPKDQHSMTPVRLGATAGLRTLPGDSAMNLLDAVKSYLLKSPLKFIPSWVSILDGTQEGAFEWITINYLLGRIGQDYGKTVGVVDLGGGSVQMAYAISDDVARNAPKLAEGEDAYIKDLKLLGKTYHLYVHSYLHYGLLAARAEILDLVKESESCPCLAAEFQGEYKYGSASYKAVGAASGADFFKCKNLVSKALQKDHACEHMQCTFRGVWNGGGGDGQKQLFVASFFFDRALQAGIIEDSEAVEAKIKPLDFERVGKEVCAMGMEDIGKNYPSVDDDDRAYFCLDLAYEYMLLVEGFAVDANQEITLVKKVKYKNAFVEAAWPLGSAIEALS